MSWFTWIVLGCLAGLAASRLEQPQRAGSLSTGHAGIAGAMLGALLFERFGLAGENGSGTYHMLVAGVGPIAVAAAYHLLFARRPAP